MLLRIIWWVCFIVICIIMFVIRKCLIWNLEFSIMWFRKVCNRVRYLLEFLFGVCVFVYVYSGLGEVIFDYLVLRVGFVLEY